MSSRARGATRVRRPCARRPSATLERRRRRRDRLADRTAPSPRRVTDATILIPTFRHAALVPLSVQSALDQEGASVEVFVVGDGAGDDTRAALEPFGNDERLCFFDFPKGPRHGELHRHEALREAGGRILLPLRRRPAPAQPRRRHACLLENADFATPSRLVCRSNGRSTTFVELRSTRVVEVGLGRKASSGSPAPLHTVEGIAGSRKGGERTPAEDRQTTTWWRKGRAPRLPRRDGGSAPYLASRIPGGVGSRRRSARHQLRDWLQRSREPARRGARPHAAGPIGARPRTTPVGAQRAAHGAGDAGDADLAAARAPARAAPLRALLARLHAGR